jgi:hypothetical protein
MAKKQPDHLSSDAPVHGASDRPPLMSHQDRQALIRRPFLTQRIPGKSWAGVLISDSVPVGGQRAYDPAYNEDESYLRYGRSDDDI